MKKNITCLTLLILFCAIACDKGDGEDLILDLSAFTPAHVVAMDVGNKGDITDLAVTFQKPQEPTDLSEFRIYVVKEPNMMEFDSAASILETNFSAVDLNVSSEQIKPSNDLDVDGETIAEGVKYVIFVSAIATDPSIGIYLSDPSDPFTLQQKSVVYTLTKVDGGTGGLDIDEAGNIYMGDFGGTTGGNPWGKKVFKITPEGVVSIFANGFSGASGNDFDSNGNLFQSSLSEKIVYKITPEGTVSQFASGFSAPVGIVVDPEENLFVCNCGANSISKVTPEGDASLFASGSLFGCPNGIDRDADGNLYVSNFDNFNLVKISPTGETTLFTSLPGRNNGHLLIHDNFIYVASRGLNQIHRVSFDGQVTLFAGSSKRGKLDGDLSEARFSLPNDLVFSHDGKKIYVNDVDEINSNSTDTSPSVIRVIELVD